MIRELESEAALCQAAGAAAVAWRDAGISPLLIGLSGTLGAGKTTWVRAMLRGLGYAGRVPSPTYTLLEHYEIGALTIVHLDLYRLGEARELEFLGLRDWLARDPVWLLAEWPEQGGAFAEALDVAIRLVVEADAPGWTKAKPPGRADAPGQADGDAPGRTEADDASPAEGVERRRVELLPLSGRGHAALAAWPGNEPPASGSHFK